MKKRPIAREHGPWTMEVGRALGALASLLCVQRASGCSLIAPTSNLLPRAYGDSFSFELSFSVIKWSAGTGVMVLFGRGRKLAFQKAASTPHRWSGESQASRGVDPDHDPDTCTITSVKEAVEPGGRPVECLRKTNPYPALTQPGCPA